MAGLPQLTISLWLWVIRVLRACNFLLVITPTTTNDCCS